MSKDLYIHSRTKHFVGIYNYQIVSGSHKGQRGITLTTKPLPSKKAVKAAVQEAIALKIGNNVRELVGDIVIVETSINYSYMKLD